ncbi:MAG: hypothetical protein JSW01_03365 [Candidatus Bathyarchaeota archaeon]|nr:MAG: hypothetical protein JSW01_03365 [Candidatus Bathyarchaeota archaeon]
MTDRVQEAYVVIMCDGAGEAESIVSAISPDNIVPGDDLIVDTWNEDREVRCVVSCRRGLRSLISTLDDILLSVKIADNTLQSIQKDV